MTKEITVADKRLLAHAQENPELMTRLQQSRPELFSNPEVVVDQDLPVTPASEEEVVESEEVVLGDVVKEPEEATPTLGGVNLAADKLEAGARAKSPLGFVDRALTGMWQTGAILTDPEVHTSLLEVARETVETIRTEASAKNSGIRTQALLTVTANAKNVLTNLGVEMDSFAEFLQAGLDRLKEDDESIPQDLQVTEPMGFAIALTRVFAPLVLAPIQATSELAAERADSIIAIGDQQNQHDLSIKKQELSTTLALVVAEGEKSVAIARAKNASEVGVIQIESEVTVAEKRDHFQQELVRGEEAKQAIDAAKSTAVGRKIAAVLKGFGYVPVAPVQGFVDSLVNFAEDKPVICIVTTGAIIDSMWLGGPPAEVVGIFVAGVMLQMVWDKMTGKYRKKTTEAIGDIGEGIKNGIDSVVDRFSKRD